MKKPAKYTFRILLSLIQVLLLHTASVKASVTDTVIFRQEIKDKQSLLNGRIWRNQYIKVSGNQFFLSSNFITGSLTFNGRRFNNLDLLYDIADDELILKGESFPTIILNKEMVDSFSLFFQNHNYNIINAGNDSSSILKGYLNVLYDGPSALYVKYYKKIQPLAVDGRFDLFYTEHRIFLRIGEEIYQLGGKKRLLYLLSDRKREIRDYIRRSRIKLRTKNPESLIPLLKFYDDLKQQIEGR
jgi:hypothetical protein